MVEIEGERVLAASCIRQPSEGMIVSTATDRAVSARKMVFELLVADQPSRDSAYDDESTFWRWADTIGVDYSRFPAKRTPDPTFLIRRWRSTWMPASTAHCVSAHAATFRSMT